MRLETRERCAQGRDESLRVLVFLVASDPPSHLGGEDVITADGGGDQLVYDRVLIIEPGFLREHLAIALVGRMEQEKKTAPRWVANTALSLSIVATILTTWQLLGLAIPIALFEGDRKAGKVLDALVEATSGREGLIDFDSAIALAAAGSHAERYLRARADALAACYEWVSRSETGGVRAEGPTRLGLGSWRICRAEAEEETCQTFTDFSFDGENRISSFNVEGRPAGHITIKSGQTFTWMTVVRSRFGVGTSRQDLTV